MIAVRQMAATLGCKRHTLIKIAQKLGIQVGYTPGAWSYVSTGHYTPEDAKRIIEEFYRRRGKRELKAALRARGEVYR